MTPDPAYDDARSWIDQHWDDSLTLREWWRLMDEERLSFPAWPVEHRGRGASKDTLDAIGRAFHDAGVLGGPTGLGVLMGAPVVFTLGNDEQKKRMIPPPATGTEGG